VSEGDSPAFSAAREASLIFWRSAAVVGFRARKAALVRQPRRAADHCPCPTPTSRDIDSNGGFRSDAVMGVSLIKDSDFWCVFPH